MSSKKGVDVKFHFYITPRKSH